MTDEEYEKKINAFIDEQVAFIQKANLEVEKNALAFHRENCAVPEAGCENTFMSLILGAMGQKIIDEIKEKRPHQHHGWN